MQKSIFFIIVAAALSLQSCKSFEPQKEPYPALEIPQTYSVELENRPVESETPFSEKNQELTNLIDNCLKNNLDQKILKARLEKAQAVLKKQSASFFPSLAFSFGGKKQESRSQKTYSGSAVYSSSHSWDSSLSSSYAADIWGRNSSAVKADQSNYQAASFDIEESRNELAASIAQIWIDVIASRNKITILNNQLENNKTILALQKLRFLNGKADALDVSQQIEALAKTGSQKPLLEKQEKLLLNSLALLSGSADMSAVHIETSRFPETIPLPEVGFPSALLENRPDIKAARMRLLSSQYDLSFAKKDLLPSFSLSAQALFSNKKLDLLFHNWVASLAGTVAAAIFDGGFKRAEIDRVKAELEEQLSSYTMAVANAVKEVEDTLITIEKQADYIRLLEKELETTRLTLQDAKIQYLNGQSSYLAWLTAQANIESLERQLIGEKAEYLKQRIILHRVLGFSFG